MKRKIFTVVIAALVIVLVLWDDFAPSGDDAFDPRFFVAFEARVGVDLSELDVEVTEKCASVRDRTTQIVGEDRIADVGAALRLNYTPEEMLAMCADYDKKSDDELAAFVTVWLD